MPTAGRPPHRCPCGSRALFTECCGPLHLGRASGEPTATTAEQLMRSRFSAFAVGDVDYLTNTWHRSTRPADLDLDPHVEWLQLEILGTTGGGATDAAGTVDFVAHYWYGPDRERGQQPENSAFVREQGQWFYVGPVRGAAPLR